MYEVDEIDLKNYMFYGEKDSIIRYIEEVFNQHDYENILKFLKELAVEVIIENITEEVRSAWSEDAKGCYYQLKKYYEGEKVKYEERQNSKRSNTSLVIT